MFGGGHCRLWQRREPEAPANGCGQFFAPGHQPENLCSADTAERRRGIPGCALGCTRSVEMPALGAEWPTFRQLCIEKRLAANAIPDAWLAAAVIQLGEHLVTFDADFKKLLKRTQVTVLPPD